jgi:hypothetical protein
LKKIKIPHRNTKRENIKNKHTNKLEWQKNTKLQKEREKNDNKIEQNGKK